MGLHSRLGVQRVCAPRPNAERARQLALSAQPPGSQLDDDAQREIRQNLAVEHRHYSLLGCLR